MAVEANHTIVIMSPGVTRPKVPTYPFHPRALLKACVAQYIGSIPHDVKGIYLV
jgi:hypothetical protein